MLIISQHLKMKKLLITAIMMFVLSANAQNINVPNTKKTVIMKFTADWCGPCGEWAWDAMDSLIFKSKNGMNAICVNVYSKNVDHAPLLLDSSYYVYEDNRDNNVFGIPSFAVSNIFATHLALNTIAPLEKLVDSITSVPPIVNSGFIPKWNNSGDELTIETKTKFFISDTGTYAVAAYLYEDNVMAPQAGQGNVPYPLYTVAHKNVLRSPTSIPPFGVQLSGSIFTPSSSFSNKFVISKKKLWDKANIVAFTIVWKKNGNKWEVANANDVATMPTSTNNIESTQVINKIYPNPVKDRFMISLSQRITQCSINILDISGKTICELYNGSVNKNAIGIQLKRPNDLTNGIYFLHINSDSGNQTMQIMLE